MSIVCKIANCPLDMKEVYHIRTEVFVDEQKVPLELEMDEWDSTAIHVLALFHTEAVGCGRIIISSSHAHIGRVAVKKQYRKKGIGKLLMHFLVNTCKSKGAKEVILHSQIHAIPFYESLGFETRGEIFLDAGIEHREMKLTELE
jgi:predicted GNAT family N-acyltransferase